MAASLLLSCSPVALHAESNGELAREIAELKAQIREMKGALAATRGETRRTAEKVRAVSARGPERYLPPPANPIPVGAVPAFVTADKKFQFGAITITPGGFLAAESVYRSKSLQADLISPFNQIPFRNNALGNQDEFRPSARQTRLALLAEAPITPTFLAAGYLEFDFLGAASTANENQTNSYTPRIRNLYAQLDALDYGVHVLAGQNWSLVTLNTKGITPRNELTPAVIDAQQTVGSLYARQAQIRLTKDFDKKLWMSLSVEEAQTTNTGCPAIAVDANGRPTGNSTLDLGNGVTVNCNFVGQGGAFVGAGNFGPAYSTNHLPDVIGKVAYEAKLGDRDVHLEATGLYTNLYDRVGNTPVAGGFTVFGDKNTSGWGAGAGLVAAVIPKVLDFQINGMFGRGIERYGAAGLPQSTFNSDGSLRALQGYIGLAGLTYHATPSIDLYSYAGIEGQFRSFTPTATGFVGPGNPGTNDSFCFIQGNGATANTCNGLTRQIFQVNAGFWDKLYKGDFGEVRVGAQYQYTNREIFNNDGSGAAPNAFYRPQTDEHAVFTSLRYYPFQANAAVPAPVVAKY